MKPDGDDWSDDVFQSEVMIIFGVNEQKTRSVGTLATEVLIIGIREAAHSVEIH